MEEFYHFVSLLALSTMLQNPHHHVVVAAVVVTTVHHTMAQVVATTYSVASRALLRALPTMFQEEDRARIVMKVVLAN